MSDTTTKSVPAINFDLLGLMFVSGFFATIAFDLWGQVIAPLIDMARLSPHGLARSLLGSLGLPNNNFMGYMVHFYIVGLIGYPVGWLFVFRPIWNAVTGGGLPWIIPAAIYGFGLWVFAIGGITWIAGLPFFLNFTGITYSALVGHVLYGIIMVLVMEMMAKRA